jgi:peptidoglycan/LPS O-acetylase OafA/YrhL
VKIPGTAQKVIVSMGGTTLGVYLMHIFIMRIFEKTGVADMIYGAAYINDMLRALLYSALVFAAAYFLTQILKKIPVLKHTVS